MIDDVVAIDEVIAEVRNTYGRWTRKTSLAEMRSDWDALFLRRARGVACRPAPGFRGRG